MIFKQVDEILSGRKTQTRRVCKPGEMALKYTYPVEHVVAVVPHPPINGVWDTFDGKPIEKIGEGLYRPMPVRWYIGHTYAVVPKRGQPGVWWKVSDGIPYAKSPIDWSIKPGLEDFYPVNILNGMIHDGWQPLRIRITAIRRERLQDISEADAKAEGVESVEAYRALWDSINGKTPDARWADNPYVWVLEFEVAK